MKKVTSILLLLLLCFPAYSQDESLTDSQTEQKSDTIKIHFDHDSDAVDLNLVQNRESLLHFSDLIEKINSDSLYTISRIEINSYASPEGGRTYNKILTQRRSNSIYDYITKTTSVPDSLIDRKYSGSDWNGLQKLIEESDLPYRDEVLYILKNVPEETWRRVNPNDRWLSLVDSRNKHLMELQYGNPYRDMFANIYPELRNGSVVTIYYKTMLPPPLPPQVIEEAIEVVDEPKIDSVETTQIQPVIEPVATEEDDDSSIKFALKTNLLYDLMLSPSIELEIPIGERWSVAGEWICPWWLTKNNGNALEILSGQVEGRYWFGDRANKPQLTGWFGGVYAGGGLYDLQWKNNGYQGEFYIAAGLAGGYAHTINKSGSLRMEYSLGVGYLSTEYRYYEGKQDNEYLVWQHDGKYTWIGPTKAKISLVWFIDWKKGGQR